MKTDVQERLENSKRGLVYAQETAKLEFASDLHMLMERQGINQKKLANRLGKSEPYVSKVLRGDCNLTIETMVSFAYECTGRLHFKVAGLASTLRWAEVIECRQSERTEHGARSWQPYSGRVGDIKRPVQILKNGGRNAAAA